MSEQTTMTELELEIRDLLIEALELQIEPEELESETPLFDVGPEGLGLDSLEALEIVVALSGKYGVEFDEDVDREVFTSIRTLANYIEAQKK